METDGDWALWAAGEKRIVRAKTMPALEYIDPLSRRRLSQISRMTIQVTHGLLEKSQCGKDVKQVFISLRGEIEREYTVNRSLIEDGEILPAAFSLSVFNTPVAVATIVLGLRGGYSAVYPAGGSFRAAFQSACAPVLCGAESRVMVIYADEYVPDCYGSLRPEPNEPLAFAALVGSAQTGGAEYIDNLDTVPENPAQFLKSMLLRPAACRAC